MGYYYDEKLYESHAFLQTSPAHLQALALLFGIKATPYHQAKVLELGCASGGNIIPLACNFPNMTIEGIELSIKEVEEGRKIIDALGLKNIKLIHQSMLDFKGKKQSYDYIICHGVYSWVDKEARDKIMEICRDYLKPNGIAVISYNTRPSWNMVGCVRDMMLFHVRNLTDHDERAKHARDLVKFLASGLEKEESAYAKFLKDELKVVMNAKDYYICHEYLEIENNPVYFYEFAQHAKDYSLNYLSDGQVSTMFAGNLKESFREKLSEIKDIVRMSQYMDFIRNMRFRTTLLSPEGTEINRQLKVEDVEKFCLSYSGKVQNKLTKEKISNNETVTFEGNGVVVTLQRPILKACMSLLHDALGKPISYETLVKESMFLSGETDETNAKLLINTELNLMRLVLAGMIQIHVDEGIFTTDISAQPNTSPLIRYMAKETDRVANLRHETFSLLPVERIVLQNLNGENKIAEIETIIEDKVNSKEFTLNDEKGVAVTDKAMVHDMVKTLTLSTLDNLARKAFLLRS